MRFSLFSLRACGICPAFGLLSKTLRGQSCLSFSLPYNLHQLLENASWLFAESSPLLMCYFIFPASQRLIEAG
jgi:hypothetical protein